MTDDAASQFAMRLALAEATAEALKARERQQATAAEFGMRALLAESLDELMRCCTEKVADTLDVELCKVLEHLPDESAFLLRAGVGWHPGLVGKAKIEDGKGSPAGFAVLSGTPVIVHDMSREDRFVDSSLLLEHRVTSGLNCIISDSQGSAFGVLGAYSTGARKFTNDDVNFLMSMANLLAIAIQNRNSQRALRESEARLRLAAEAGGMGVWRWSLKTGETIWNNREFELLGMKPKGTSDVEAFFAAVYPEDRDSLRHQLAEVVRTHGALDAEFRIRTPEGSTRWLAGRGTVELDENGEAVSMIGVNFDITDQKLTQDVLREADRRKNDFLAVLSHELRNPLSAIVSSLPLLDIGELNLEEAKWAREVIERQTRHLSRLIDDLLDISRITRGKVELRKERVSLTEVVRAAVESMQRHFKELGHELEISVDSPAIEILVDPARIEQVLVNLLNNACKFIRGTGKVTVIARLEGDEAVVSVCDNGIGIAPEDLSTIFVLFSQVSAATSVGRDGVGIGLALSREIIELHGGTICADSKGIGKGATFTIRLPEAQLGDVVPPPPEHHNPPRSVRSRRILIVDDERDSAEALARLLRRKGHQVETVFESRLALAAVARVVPEIVLLDLSMPGRDGFEIAAAIRKENDRDGLLLVAATGFAHDDYRSRSQEAGFDHHLVKPIDLEVLEALLDTSS